MREILFRGKRVDNGEWAYGAFVPDATEPTHRAIVTWGFIRYYDGNIRKTVSVEVDRKTVGQYTGLTDKNGKMIFEGDNVRTYLPENNIHKEIELAHGVVAFEGGSFGIRDKSGKWTRLDDFAPNVVIEVTYTIPAPPISDNLEVE